MGGQEGNRGYLVQAIIALLRSLEGRIWETVTIEPDEASQKIDVRWTVHDRTRAVQIKSSQNQIGKADAERWATELKRSCTADDYELLLVGPVAQSVVELNSFDGVAIPCPKTLDLIGLLDEAAHLLGRFLTRESMHQQSTFGEGLDPPGNPLAQESLLLEREGSPNTSRYLARSCAGVSCRRALI